LASPPKELKAPPNILPESPSRLTPQFVQGLGLPVLGHLRDTQNYVHLAARGLTVFDVTPGRVEKDLLQWEGICQWLDA